MNRLFAASMCCALLGAGLVCAQEKPKDAKDSKDTFESVVTDMMASLKKGTDTLKSVKDEKSAKDAKPALTKVGEDMQKLSARAQKLGKPTKEQEDALEKKFKGQMETHVKDFQSEAARVAKEPWGKDLLKALEPKAPATPKPPSKPKDGPKKK